MPRPTSQDLAGFWDLLQLSIEDVSMKFDELHQLKLNEWKIIESPEKKVSTIYFQIALSSCWWCTSLTFKPEIIFLVKSLVDNTLQKCREHDKYHGRYFSACWRT